MAMTKIYLMQVPLENDYKHTLYFADRAAQQSYFASKATAKNTFTDFTYQRKDEKIRVNAQYDSVINCNYCMYQNTAYNDKWFYAFIIDIKYISDGVTEIYIETDVMQTWLFDYTLKQCFVEREHTNNDTIGVNTVPECLETGDYICNSKHKYAPLLNKAYVIGSTADLRKDDFPNYAGGIYNGVISAANYYLYTSVAELQGAIFDLDKAGKGDAVTGVFMVPKDFIVLDDSGVSKNLVVGLFAANVKKWSASEPISKPGTVNGYTPKNNKLLTYPYNYMLMSNNAGGAAVYKYELFSSSNCDFNICFALTPGCSIRLIPLKYSGIDENNEEGLNGAKFPIGSWANDIYINWLTQTSLNRETQIQMSTINAAAGIVTNTASGTISGAASGLSMGGGYGAAIGAGIGGLTSSIGSTINGAMSVYGTIASINAEKYAHSLQPPQASGNLNSGDVTLANSDLTFTAYKMSVKAEFARVIDDYFTMYGYQTNRVKVPNKNHRSRFWYTKTVGCEIDGAMAQRDMQKIKACYDNGITFWRKADDIAIYNTANAIL